MKYIHCSPPRQTCTTLVMHVVPSPLYSFTFTRDVEEKLAKEQKSTGGPKLWHTILLAQHQAAQRRVSDLQTTMKTLSHKHEKNLAAATSRRMTLKRHKKPTKMLHEL